MQKPTDNELLEACFSSDTALAAVTVKLFKKRVSAEREPSEPPHCSECFEGCSKCQK